MLGAASEVAPKKPIEFVKILDHYGKILNAVREPYEFSNIELICFSYCKISGKNYDLIFAYDDDRNGGSLYLGHFNDGVVE